MKGRVACSVIYTPYIAQWVKEDTALGMELQAVHVPIANM